MGKYATFEACFKAVFPRTLYVSGIDDPESFASKEDLDYIWNGYRTMSPRPGCAEMLQILRDGGYTVWCLSNASVERVKGLWDNHGMDMPSGTQRLGSTSLTCRIMWELTAIRQRTSFRPT